MLDRTLVGSRTACCNNNRSITRVECTRKDANLAYKVISYFAHILITASINGKQTDSEYEEAKVCGVNAGFAIDCPRDDRNVIRSS